MDSYLFGVINLVNYPELLILLLFIVVWACLDLCHAPKRDQEDDVVLPLSTNEKGVKITEEQAREKCVICLDPFQEPKQQVVVLDNCKHMFHHECIAAWTGKKQSCPVCRSVINRVVVSEVEIIIEQ